MPIALDTQGLHPTTDACLEMLQSLQDNHEFSRILEIGCGNGILSIIAASIWDAPVLAVDISQKAVEDTRHAVVEYELEDLITVERSDGCSHPSVARNAPYDLVICNLLADVLLQIAHDVVNLIKSDGYCLFSGMLEWRSQEVVNVYESLGFEIIQKKTFSPWQLLLLRHKKKS